MKKVSLFIILIALVFISNAQTAKIVGSWLMTKAEVNGEIDEPNFITDFQKNGDMVIMDMKAGTWKYNKKKNSIVMKSDLDKDFNGENKILNLTDKEMVLMKGEAKLFYIRINKEKILKDNKASGLEGVWRIQGEDGDLTILSFKLPDEFMYINKGDGYSERSGGTWTYDVQDENVRIVCGGIEVEGTNKIVKITIDELKLENKANIILAKKVEKSLVKIERLEFTEDDYYTEDGDFKYNDDDQKLPWQDSYEMLKSLVNVNQLVYKYSTLIERTEVFDNKILRANVIANQEERSLSIDYIFRGYDTYNLPDDSQLRPNNDYSALLFPEEDDYYFRVAGTEQITTPAGTFDCTIIEVLNDSDVRKKLWMINNKPGIYAKIIHDKTGSWGYYSVYELQGIE